MRHAVLAVGTALLVMAGSARGATQPSIDAAPAATIDVSPAGDELHADGVIGTRFDTDVRDALDRHPGVTRLVVSGPGGMRAQALRVAEMANARGLTVRVSGHCASACALLWAASNAREMRFDAGLGLHRSALDPSLPLPALVRTTIMARNDRQTDDVLRRAGFPERVIAIGAATPASSMSWFSPYELKTGGVPFVLVDADGRAASLDLRTGRLVGGVEAPMATASGSN